MWVSPWTEFSHAGGAGQLRSPKELLLSAFLGWDSMSVPPWMEIYAFTNAGGFFVYEFWELNIGSHICKASILPIELSPQSSKYELNYLNCSV